MFAVGIMAFSLVACSENHIPLGEYRIEWDNNDPNLHGQKVHFKMPMSYVLLENKHLGDYRKEEIAIGRLIQSEDEVFEPGGAAKNGYSSEQIKDGIEFTIKASYWYRRDWFERELNGDIRYVVFIDKNGVESVSDFIIFKLYSDRPEFTDLKNEGRFK